MAKVKKGGIKGKNNKEKPNATKASTLAKAITKVKKFDEAKKELKDGEARRGIILLEHIPHGFYEDEIKSFFSQYGKVLRVKVARAKKTGKSKGYAFVEFEFEEVAKIAAESMNNYLMFERLVKCKLLQGAVANGRKIFGDTSSEKVKRKILQKDVKKEKPEPSTAEEKTTVFNRRVMKLRLANAKLESLGIDYQFAPASNPALKLVKAGALNGERGVNGVTAEAKDQGTKDSSKKTKSPNIKSPKGETKLTRKERISLIKKQTAKSPNQKALKKNDNSVESTLDSQEMIIAETTSEQLKTSDDDGILPSVGKKSKSPKQNSQVVDQTPKRVSNKSKGSLTPIVSQSEDKISISEKSPKTTPKKSPKIGKEKPTPKNTPKTQKNKITPQKSPKAPTDNVNPKKSPKAQAANVTPKKSPIAQTANVTPKKSPIAQTANVTPNKTPKTPKDKPKKSPKIDVSFSNDEIPDVAEILFPSQAPTKRKNNSSLAQVVEEEKSPKIAKISPKLKSQSPADSKTPSSTAQAVKPSGKNKKKKSLDSRVSPKMLRSNRRQSEAVESNEAPVTNINKKPPKPAKSVSVKEAVAVPKAGKSPKKFSPKVLRSKGAKKAPTEDTPQIQKPSTPKIETPAKQQGGKKEKPKFSPKVLRSAARHSDSPARGKSGVTKAARGRKSMR